MLKLIPWTGRAIHRKQRSGRGPLPLLLPLAAFLLAVAVALPRFSSGKAAVESQGNKGALPFSKQASLRVMETWNLSHRLKIVGEPLRPSLTWHMAVKKGNREVPGILDAGIRKVKSIGEYDRIYPNC